MWLLYAQWRYRGLDPFTSIHGEGEIPTHRYEAMMAGFAVYAARIDEAGVTGLG